MSADVVKLIAKLPPYQGKALNIKKSHRVSDIEKEILNAHQIFADDYDKIAENFDLYDLQATALVLWRFLKENVEYREEGEKVQRTKSPAAILTHGHCDCKCYSLFVAGVLDSLRRSGRLSGSIDFAFAGYDGKSISHVFVIATGEDGKEFWIDPVLKKFNTRTPNPTTLKRRPIMLQRISGIATNREQCLDPVRTIDDTLVEILTCNNQVENVLPDYGTMEPELFRPVPQLPSVDLIDAMPVDEVQAVRTSLSQVTPAIPESSNPLPPAQVPEKIFPWALVAGAVVLFMVLKK